MILMGGHRMIPVPKTAYVEAPENILRGAVMRATHALKDVARAMGGTGENHCTVTVESTEKGEHSEIVPMFVGDVVYEILRDAPAVKRIIIEPVR